MPNHSKYRGYENLYDVALRDRSWPNKVLTEAPLWCSVDLRDGNQALIKPMDVQKKLIFFDLLTSIGFKEIEIGFPSASDTEFQFTRSLLETGRLRDDLWPQVLTQARQPLISRTFDSLSGYKQAIVHLYNSTSELQRRVVFKMDPNHIANLAVQGTRLVKEHASKTSTKIRFEYSPESFTGTERAIALDICAAVIEEWQPTPDDKMIINLPATVEMSTPNVYADLIEWFSRNVPNRDSVIISVHTHNDRGTGVAATELGILAGAERVEGTLFGNGERTGNVDLVTVALNLFTQGINPGLDLSNIPKIAEIVESCTEMSLHPRHPYAGDLVFTAFSGSHQDAIRKGMHALEQSRQAVWEVPYIPVDPSDIGREFQGIVRINSQSGKGGIAFVMEKEFGCHLPKEMHPEFGSEVQKISDATGEELTPERIWNIFEKTYLHRSSPLDVLSFTSTPTFKGSETYEGELTLRLPDGRLQDTKGLGNGPIDACRAALLRADYPPFRIVNYVEHARSAGSDAEAVSFIQIETSTGKRVWGAGIHTSIETASIRALVCAVNRSTGE